MHSILISGCGHVGMLASISLARAGIPSVIIDARDAVTISHPPKDGRFLAISNKTISLLKKIQVWDFIDQKFVSPLNSARVVDGGDKSFYMSLFNHYNSNDGLGVLVNAQHIYEACYRALLSYGDLITIKHGCALESIEYKNSYPVVRLSNQEKAQVDLLIAADGHLSTIRKELNIPVRCDDFNATIITCHVSHSRPNHGIAWEKFFYGGNIAILPLQNNESSVILTFDHIRAQEWVKKDPSVIRQDLENIAGEQLGSIELLDTPTSYPLKGFFCKKFFAPRVALIGDAAIRMHPISAYGFNFGVQSQDILTGYIIDAHLAQKDIGSTDVLLSYDISHRQKTILAYYGIKAIVELFTNESSSAKFLRPRALKLANMMVPIKSFVVNKIIGR